MANVPRKPVILSEVKDLSAQNRDALSQRKRAECVILNEAKDLTPQITNALSKRKD